MEAPELRKSPAPLLIKDVRIVGATEEHVTDVLIRNGMIAEIRPDLPASSIRTLAANGRWVIPGLWDQHVHFTQWARARQRLNLSGATDPGAVTTAVATHIAGLDAADRKSMIVGFGFRTGTWSRVATVAELDAISGDHPVVLISGDVHTGWLNSAAARALSITPPVGVITEGAWFAVMPRATETAESGVQLHDHLATALAEASTLGIVGMSDLEMTDGWNAWPAWYAAGLDSVRVRTAVYPDRLEEVIVRGLRTGDALGDTDGMITMGPLKIIADGSLNTRTAFCHSAYADDPQGGRGLLNFEPAELRSLLSIARRHRLGVALHAIGDAALSVALDAYAVTGAAGSIEHAQLISLPDLHRMAQLGIIASVQPAHLLDDRDVTFQCWPDRADRCFAFRSMIDSGVPLAFGSDAPVSPLDPWLAMAAAVHRSADDRDPWNATQAITPAEALAASVDGKAVRTGNPGDLVVLDDNPLRAAADSGAAARQLQDTRVSATVVAGQITYAGLG